MGLKPSDRNQLQVCQGAGEYTSEIDEQKLQRHKSLTYDLYNDLPKLHCVKKLLEMKVQ